MMKHLPSSHHPRRGEPVRLTGFVLAAALLMPGAAPANTPAAGNVVVAPQGATTQPGTVLTPREAAAQISADYTRISNEVTQLKQKTDTCMSQASTKDTIPASPDAAAPSSVAQADCQALFLQGKLAVLADGQKATLKAADTIRTIARGIDTDLQKLSGEKAGYEVGRTKNTALKAAVLKAIPPNLLTGTNLSQQDETKLRDALRTAQLIDLRIQEANRGVAREDKRMAELGDAKLKLVAWADLTESNGKDFSIPMEETRIQLRDLTDNVAWRALGDTQTGLPSVLTGAKSLADALGTLGKGPAAADLGSGTINLPDAPNAGIADVQKQLRAMVAGSGKQAQNNGAKQ